jgi:hypothetical protein
LELSRVFGRELLWVYVHEAWVSAEVLVDCSVLLIDYSAINRPYLGFRRSVSRLQCY